MKQTDKLFTNKKVARNLQESVQKRKQERKQEIARILAAKEASK